MQPIYKKKKEVEVLETTTSTTTTLRVEYAERSINYGILFICSPFHEYNNLEYVHVPV